MAGTLQFSTPQVQGFVNIIFYIILAIIIVVVLGFLIWKLIQNARYKFHVTVFKKVGDAQIEYPDMAMQTKLEGNYMFHYKNMNVYSPVIASKYFRLKKVGKSVKQSFSVYMDGISIFPIAFDIDATKNLVPIDLDQFNYMQQRIKAIAEKYVRTNKLLQLLPYLAVGGIIVMFIVGMIFYTKHVENVSNAILNTVMKAVEVSAQNTGQVQVITGV